MILEEFESQGFWHVEAMMSRVFLDLEYSRNDLKDSTTKLAHLVLLWSSWLICKIIWVLSLIIYFFPIISESFILFVGFFT